MVLLTVQCPDRCCKLCARILAALLLSFLCAAFLLSDGMCVELTASMTSSYVCFPQSLPARSFCARTEIGTVFFVMGLTSAQLCTSRNPINTSHLTGLYFCISSFLSPKIQGCCYRGRKRESSGQYVCESRRCVRVLLSVANEVATLWRKQHSYYLVSIFSACFFLSIPASFRTWCSD